MVKSEVLSTLTEPQSVVQKQAVIFGELLAWGARRAIGLYARFSAATLLMPVVAGIYNHRKDGFVSDEIVAYAVELTSGIDA